MLWNKPWFYLAITPTQLCRAPNLTFKDKTPVTSKKPGARSKKAPEKNIKWKILNSVFLHSGPQLKPAPAVFGPTLQTLPFAQITLAQHSHSISRLTAAKPGKLLKPGTRGLAGVRGPPWPPSSSAFSGPMPAGRQIHYGAWCMRGKRLWRKVDELNDIYIISGFSAIQSKSSQGLFIKVFFKDI